MATSLHQDQYQAFIAPSAIRSRDLLTARFHIQVVVESTLVNEIMVSNLTRSLFEVSNATAISLGSFPEGTQVEVQYRVLGTNNSEGTWTFLTKAIQFTPLKPYFDNAITTITVARTRQYNTVQFHIEATHVGTGIEGCEYQWCMSPHDYNGEYSLIETHANVFTTTTKPQYSRSILAESFFYVRLKSSAEVYSDWNVLHDSSTGLQIDEVPLALETPDGAQAKAYAARDEAKVYADTPMRQTPPQPDTVTIANEI